MGNSNTYIRWQQVFNHLNTLISGNFSTQIPSTQQNDEVEELIVLLNMFTQKQEAIFKEYAYERPRKSFLFKSKMGFLLNKNFEIINASSAGIMDLSFDLNDVIGKNFKSLLNDSSRQDWELIEKELEVTKVNYFNLRLCFTTKTKLLIQADCSITKWLVNKHAAYSISSDETVILMEDPKVLLPEIWKNIERNKKKPTRTAYPKPTSPSELNNIRKLRKYIEKNSEIPVLDFKTVANKLGTNETKIAEGFKHVFKVTPSQYHREERYRKIRNQIVNTNMLFSQISEFYGFKSYSHFSKLIKGKYGLSPRDIRKNENKDN